MGKPIELNTPKSSQKRATDAQAVKVACYSCQYQKQPQGDRMNAFDIDAAKKICKTTTANAITRNSFISKTATEKRAHLPTTLSELEKQAKAINGGDLSDIETMLISQSNTLDSVFTSLALKASHNLDDSRYFKAGEMYLKMALKAQSQCRATLQTLAEMKQPRQITITQQANIAGQQIVNNAGAQEKPNPKNELLGVVNHEQIEGEWMDTRAPRKAGGTNQVVEAVGTVNRSANARG